MSRMRSPWFLSVPVALVFGAGAAFGKGVAEGPDLRGVIAVVDVERVQQSFPFAIEREDQIKAAQELVNRELAKIEQSARGLQMEAEAYEKGSPEYDDALVAAAMERHRYEVEGEKFAARLQRQRAEFIKEISAKLRLGIARFSKEKGYDLVLRRRSETAGLRSQVESDFVEDVLFSDAQLDVTDQLIQYLKTAGPDDDK